jgi:protein-S-isoprenylcysteine O-methyltransferase Ste14
MKATLAQTLTSFALPKVPANVLLDMADRTFVICAFTHFAIRTHDHFLKDHDLRFILLLLSEILPIAFVIVRPIAQEISRRPSDWIVALVGSSLPLLISLAPFNALVPGALCYSLVIIGLLLQISAKVFLGLSFGVVAANRGVKVGGPYAFIRHPMYAGYTLSHIGISLAMPSLLNASLYLFCFGLQIVRMSREEAVLMRDEKYKEFAQTVRYRLLPGVY